MCWVYVKDGRNGPWIVGFYVEGHWTPVTTIQDEQDAMRRVNYLNGGSGDPPRLAL